MKYLTAILAALCALALVVPQAYAVNITVPDGIADSVWDGGPFGVGKEVNEVEKGAIANKTWDLQAFIVENGYLSLEATFDMVTGYGVYDDGTTAGPAPMGDIFVRIGKPVDQIAGLFDYVIDIDWKTFDYVVTGSGTKILLTGDTIVPTGGALNSKWLWRAADDQTIDVTYRGSAKYFDGDVNVLSGIYLDPQYISGDVHFYATQWCGNDVIRGNMAVPDGGAMLMLLGISLAGIGGLRRRG